MSPEVYKVNEDAWCLGDLSSIATLTLFDSVQLKAACDAEASHTLPVGRATCLAMAYVAVGWCAGYRDVLPGIGAGHASDHLQLLIGDRPLFAAARVFEDKHIGAGLDASHILWWVISNDPDALPEPTRSLKIDKPSTE
ncbi:hypothetical protein ACS8Y6_18200 [Salinisphaera sp. RV14]|uniref:hypothetical protein n=1 Tax=unclassified Salinisphaera TaxID=2649847 RepID=UPI003F825417